MDSIEIDGAATPENHQVSKRRRREEVGDEPVEVLAERGWTTFKDTMSDTIFMPGRLIFEGQLHATNKLCVCGKIVVTGKLECEGNFLLQRGSVQCRNHPAVVKNLLVCSQGHIYGDLQVNNLAYIDGTLTVSGALTVNGELKIKGTLKCNSLVLNGTLTKLSTGSKVTVHGESIINGVDRSLLQGASVLQQWLQAERRES